MQWHVVCYGCVLCGVEGELVRACWLPVSVGADVVPEYVGDRGWLCCLGVGEAAEHVVGWCVWGCCLGSGMNYHVQVVVVLQVLVQYCVCGSVGCPGCLLYDVLVCLVGWVQPVTLVVGLLESGVCGMSCLHECVLFVGVCLLCSLQVVLFLL